MVKVGAIFSDYDGTLCPLELRREDAYLSPILRRLLTRVSKAVPFGIITTKDLAFIRERVPFAHGISASCGLEMQVGEKVTIDDRVRCSNDKFQKVYQEVLKQVLQTRENLMIERKETDDENMIGFCIDWRLTRNWDEAKRRAAPLLAHCREEGLYVVESDISPFANVFPIKVDKGEAFRKLKEAMGVNGEIVYLGDSEVDDPAFELAEISVGVKHRRIMPKLRCKYRIEFFEMENFLSKLLDSDFDFQEDMVQKNQNV
jgi:HAD superfamily hydrolase (TIGR01484 family)